MHFPPPLLLSLDPARQIITAVVLPAVFGIITGVLLGVSEIAYLVFSVLGIAGGIAAGFEHLGAGEGAQRGLCGGVLFGVFILLAHAVGGMEAKAELVEPQWILVVITTVLGVAFGAIGGALRARRERREGGATSAPPAPAA